MKEKKVERLFVASEVHLQKRVWVGAAHNAYGEMSYSFFISPKKTLVYSRTDENGETKFYLYDTDEEIYEPWYYPCSFTDFDSAYGTYVSSGSQYGYGYLIPVEEYFDIPTDTHPFFVKALLNLDNMLKKANKKSNFFLSTDEKEARSQLATLVGYKGKRIFTDTVAKLPVWKKEKPAKRKIEQLFVVSKVYDDFEEIERWVQYDTEGIVEHYIMVSKRKQLAYISTDSDGKTHVYLYSTGKEILCDPTKDFKSSVTTTSSPWWPTSIIGEHFVAEPDVSKAKLVTRKELKAHNKSIKDDYGAFGYLTPIHSYTGTKTKSPFIASICVYFSNVGKKGYMRLSMDEDIARGQLAKFGYESPIEEKGKTKKLS